MVAHSSGAAPAPTVAPFWLTGKSRGSVRANRPRRQAMLSETPNDLATLKHHRYHELDSMRAIAALGVICWHYVNTYRTAPFGHVLAPFYGRGLLMVDFFFVLSGFVLAQAFWNDRRSPTFIANIGTRLARVYPLHLVMLCVVASLQRYLTRCLGAAPFTYPHNDAYHFALNLALLNASGLQEGFSFNAPSWSISTEFLINVLFLSIITLPRRWARASMAVVACIAIAVTAERGPISMGKVLGLIDHELIRTASGFFIGVGAHAVHTRLRERGPAVIWDAVAILVAASVAYYLSSHHWYRAGDVVTCFVGFPILILAVIRSSFVRLLLRLRPLVYLGEISYSIYLVHFPLMLAIHVWSTATATALPVDSRWYFASLIVAVILVASVTYRCIETPGKWLVLRAIGANRHDGFSGFAITKPLPTNH